MDSAQRSASCVWRTIFGPALLSCAANVCSMCNSFFNFEISLLTRASTLTHLFLQGSKSCALSILVARTVCTFSELAALFPYEQVTFPSSMIITGGVPVWWPHASCPTTGSFMPSAVCSNSPHASSKSERSTHKIVSRGEYE